jgi:nucleoside-diphosphate-sugar epimerase
MKAVVTGASGFLGRAVVGQLIRAGLTVVPVTRRRVPGAVQVEHYADAPSGDVLVHLAESAQRSVAERLGSAYERDATSTIDALLAKPYRRVIYASSAALYGDQASTPRRPDDEVYVTDAYTRVKRHAEIRVLQHSGGLVARLTNLFGPGMAPENVMSTILQQLTERGPLKVRDSAPVRDFLWVDDAAEAIGRMATGEPVGVFNLGTGEGTSVAALALLALDIAGQRGRPIASAQAEGRFSHLVLDISSTVATWRWSPATDLRDGLAQLMRMLKDVDA